MTSYFQNDTSLMPLYEIHLIFRVKSRCTFRETEKNFLTSQIWANMFVYSYTVISCREFNIYCILIFCLLKQLLGN